MKFRSFTLFLFFVLFTISVFAQTNKLIGKWSLQSIKANGDEIVIPIGQSSPKMRIIDFQNGGKLSLRVNCNSASGKYVVKKGNKFTYKSGITTMMFCGTEEHNFSDIFNKAFTKVNRFTIKNKVLTFQDNVGANILTFIPAPKEK